MTILTEHMAGEPVYPCCGHCDHDPPFVHFGEPCCVDGCPGGVPMGGEGK